MISKTTVLAIGVVNKSRKARGQSRSSTGVEQANTRSPPIHTHAGWAVGQRQGGGGGPGRQACSGFRAVSSNYQMLWTLHLLFDW